MRFLKIGDLGGVRNIKQNTGVEKNTAALPKFGVFGFGFSSKSSNSAPVAHNSSLPSELVAKFADVHAPKGKPTQLVISDKDYIPDENYVDVE